MVVDYGFWFLTNRLANDQSSVVGRFAYNKKFWKRDDEEQNELSYPVSILNFLKININQIYVF